MIGHGCWLQKRLFCHRFSHNLEWATIGTAYVLSGVGSDSLPVHATQMLWAHTPRLKNSAGHYPVSLDLLHLHYTCRRGTKDFHHLYKDPEASQCLEKSGFPHGW